MRNAPQQVSQKIPARSVLRRRKRWLFRVLAAIFGLLAASPIVELAIRILLTLCYRGTVDHLPPGLPQDPGKRVQLGELMRADPNPRLVYRFKPAARGNMIGVSVQINKLGFRDEPVAVPKPPRTLRVLGLGDSTMFGWGVNRKECYLELLEDEFRSLLGPEWRVEFVNAAVPGYTAVQEVETFLRHNLDLAPDAVVIQYDRNDTEITPLLVKPDFLFARVLFLTRPRQLTSGSFADGGALQLLGQYDRLKTTPHPTGGWVNLSDAYTRLAQTCRQRNILLFAILQIQRVPSLSLEDAPDPRADKIAGLCRRLDLPAIEILPRMRACLMTERLEWPKTIIGLPDCHPNAIGHALIAQAALPVLLDGILPRLGIQPAARPRFAAAGNHILRQLTAEGLHITEDWGNGVRVNWTSRFTHFKIIPAGARLRVPLMIGHPDISSARPVEVTIRVDGFPTADGAASRRIKQASYTDGGGKTIELDLSGLKGFPLEFSLSVNRTYRTVTDPRPMGVALYPLEFDSPVN